MVKILVAGDFCPIGRIDGLLKDKLYPEIFNGFENIISSVDFAIVNLECPITMSNEKILKTGPCIKTENLNSLEALKFAGFNAVTLANNHIRDYGSSGVLDTIHHVTKSGFDFMGAGRNRDEAKLPLIKTIGGKRIAFVNIAENEFCNATKTEAGAYTFDYIENFNTITSAKQLADFVVVIYHGGREHYQLPTPETRQRLRYFADLGADTVIGHHTHCIGGYEYYNDKPIVYSLGNFIFDYKKKYQIGQWIRGYSVILTLEKGAFKLEFIPHIQGAKENPTLRILKGEEKEIFNREIDVLKNIIINDDLFIEEWGKYLETQEQFYLASLYVKNIFIRVLFLKGILPISLLRKKHNRLLLNLIRCESHHEIARNILARHALNTN